MANISQALNNDGRNATFPYEEGPYTTVFIVLLFFLIIATVLTNSAVFFAVYTFRGLRTVTNCFVISLASADLAVALISMPTWLMQGLLQLQEDEGIVFHMSTVWVELFCCSASIFNATLVSIDRYLAINKPLRYREMVTRRRANKSIIAVWILSFLVAAISYLQFKGNEYIYGIAIFLFITIFCIPLCIMCFSYISIYRAAVAQLSKMSCNGHMLSMGEEEKKKFLNAERRKRFYKELRITKTLAITVSLFAIAWAPYLIMIIIETFYQDIVIPFAFEAVALWIPFINSFANPLIYTGINKDFRKALKKLLCSNRSICYCAQKDDTERSRGNAFLSLAGSLHGDETATTSFNRTSNSRRQEMQCTSL
ncbi:probable G-protein coupled receptor No9 [Actinia tenebrosa]|uniref:Probable G-protein coupled receptor No9 n=1 Tax=Actinia tenebrosa TaxID=6105 RepID=A0A6P8IUV1_ACTTE|nr:probable G-protein coupled receptor No9 [Actinia tenebrosa]